MSTDVKIIVTLGPATGKEEDLQRIKDKGVNFVRVNMSHSSLEDLKYFIGLAKKVGITFVIDTEGSQIRTGELSTNSISLKEKERNKNKLNDFFESFWPETKLAIKAALSAGKEVLKIYNNGFTATYKKDTTPITEADLRSNEIITQILSSSGIYLLSEENTENNFSENLSEKTPTKLWIVDPLDGTADFINKTGEFAVMIALVENQKPILGVIYQPVGDQLFVAQKNSGAFFKDKENWIKLKVNTQNKLKESKAVVSKNHLEEIEKDFLDTVGISSFSQKGSCGLKVAEICLGNAELYFTRTHKIKIWDTAAAYCLITEAGGKITNILGEEIRYNLAEINHQTGVLVSNGKIHEEISKQWSEFIKRNPN